jgi:ferredoxin-NADP reductase
MQGAGQVAERSYGRHVVEHVVAESELVKSFHLVAESGAALEPNLPGQHLPLKLTIPGQPRPVYRCYTISNYAAPFYRLTIKKELPPAEKSDVPGGLSSHYFHEQVQPGTIIEAKPPSGNFWLDLRERHPVVMLAGGIGVTPMMSMLEALARSRAQRDVYFFFALRHAADHVFRNRLSELARENQRLHVQVIYEHAGAADVQGRDYHATGRIGLEMLRAALPTLDMEYYLCGPPRMMKAVSEQLVEQRVAPERIRTESFGPSSVALRALISSDATAQSALQDAGGVTVTFARSQVSVPWTGEVQTLLQLAEMNGVDISSGCQYGDCGTCMTRLLEGTVQYLHPTGARPDPGACLPCSCRPERSVVLDA